MGPGEKAAHVPYLVPPHSGHDVAGMLPENTVNGVRVWRPMLPFGKDVVYDFAHKFGVPYFKDTTPSWSTRGKLRRQLVRRSYTLNRRRGGGGGG